MECERLYLVTGISRYKLQTLFREEFGTFPEGIRTPIKSPLGSLISEIFMHGVILILKNLLKFILNVPWD